MFQKKVGGRNLETVKIVEGRNPRGVVTIFLCEYIVSMAVFSEDLFDVFEEKSDPVTPAGKKKKKRAREEGREGSRQTEEPKRPKTNVGGDNVAGSSTSAVGDEPVSSSVSQATNVKQGSTEVKDDPG